MATPHASTGSCDFAAALERGLQGVLHLVTIDRRTYENDLYKQQRPPLKAAAPSLQEYPELPRRAADLTIRLTGHVVGVCTGGLPEGI